MIQNTLETLIEEIKDLSGQTNASTAKIIRAVNRGVDRISVIKQLKASKTNPDSSNHTNISRANVTTSDIALAVSGGTISTGEVLTFRHIELLQGDQYIRLHPIDSRDAEYEYLQNQTGVPEYFDIDGEQIRLFPKPNGLYTYRITYTRVHPRFTVNDLGGPTGLLPVEEEFVVMYATDRIMIGGNDSFRVQVRNEIASLQRDIENMVGLRDQSQSRRIKPKASSITRNNFITKYNQGI